MDTRLDNAIDIAIIGAGPIGSYLGYKLARSGKKIVIAEEHSTIGKPEQCTGIISRNVEEYIPSSFYKHAILNKVNGAQIFCGNKQVDIQAKDFKAYIFDRAKFDQGIAENAQKAGCELLFKHSYTYHHSSTQSSEKRLKIALKTPDGNKNKEIIASTLVGADGPVSTVAKKAGMYGTRQFWYGIQVLAQVKKPQFDKDKVQLFFDQKYSDKFFAWVAPVDEQTAKIGLATRSNPKLFMDRFIKERFNGGKGMAKICDVQEHHYGLIPRYNYSAQVQNNQKNVFLVGDAALQVKATTGGGVVIGMQAADALHKALTTGDLNYASRLSAVNRNLLAHLMIRKKLDRMNDSSYNDMISLLNSPKTKNVLQQEGDMDYPLKFGTKLFMTQPRLLKFLF